jgi:hypothetical protein
MDIRMPLRYGDKTVKEKLTKRPALDIDADLLAFLHTRINSFVKWDVIQFFHRNPNTIDTADNIARYIGRTGKTVREEMAELSNSGILEEDGLGDVIIYSLSRDPEIRDQLHQFAQRCDDQQFKLKAVYHVLRSMR